MNIQQFQYVVAVADFRNFALAADKCYVAQSTLSTMIGKLESEIGIKIFNRKTKPVSITNEGIEIINRLRIILNEVDTFKDLVQELKGELSGEVKIGIIPTIAPYLLPLFLTTFANHFPKVKIILKEMTTTEIQASLMVRGLDIGILALPLNNPDLQELELYNEPFLIYDCSENFSDKTIAVEDLDYSKLCLLQEGHCLRTQVQKICELSHSYLAPKQNFEFESGSMDSLMRITKSQKGITIIPYLASIDAPPEIQHRLRNFSSPIPVRKVGFITHKFFVKKKLLKELQKIIQMVINDKISSPSNYEVYNPL